MPHARFEVSLTPRGEGWAALGPRGADEAEFLFSANPGMPLRPLRETASGGELSRAMLALKSVATLTSDVGTLIFDEVDTGIGGVTATGLGERLARLADAHADPLHHPPAAGGRLRRPPLRHHQGQRRRRRHHRDGGAARSRARSASPRCAACSAPAPRTRRRAATPRASWRGRASAPADLPAPRGARGFASRVGLPPAFTALSSWWRAAADDILTSRSD